MSDLLPCPFCGGEAQEGFNSGHKTHIYCIQCKAQTGFVNVYEQEAEENIDRTWNERANLESEHIRRFQEETIRLSQELHNWRNLTKNYASSDLHDALMTLMYKVVTRKLPPESGVFQILMVLKAHGYVNKDLLLRSAMTTEKTWDAIGEAVYNEYSERFETLKPWLEVDIDEKDHWSIVAKRALVAATETL